MNHKRFLKSRSQYFDLDTRIIDDGTSRTVFTTGNVKQEQEEMVETPKFAVEITIEDMEDMINNLKAHIRQIKKQNEEKNL
jgi:adenylate kinase family enzyme